MQCGGYVRTDEGLRSDVQQAVRDGPVDCFHGRASVGQHLAGQVEQRRLRPVKASRRDDSGDRIVRRFTVMPPSSRACSAKASRQRLALASERLRGRYRRLRLWRFRPRRSARVRVDPKGRLLSVSAPRGHIHDLPVGDVAPVDLAVTVVPAFAEVARLAALADALVPLEGHGLGRVVDGPRLPRGAGRAVPVRPRRPGPVGGVDPAAMRSPCCGGGASFSALVKRAAVSDRLPRRAPECPAQNLLADHGDHCYLSGGRARERGGGTRERISTWVLPSGVTVGR